MFNGKASLSIVHTESSRGWGGQERRILREMELMQSLGHRVMLVAPERSEIFRQATARRVPAVAARFERSRFPAEILRLKSIFQKLKPVAGAVGGDHVGLELLENGFESQYLCWKAAALEAGGNGRH